MTLAELNTSNTNAFHSPSVAALNAQGPVLLLNGPKTAFELTNALGVAAKPALLERVLRACASVGIFTESASGCFGPTPLSDVLTAASPVSIKKLTEIFGASWWKIWGELEAALRTGESQPKALFGAGQWDYCRSNPKEMEAFGEAMKSNSLASLRGVLEHCDFSGVGTVVDVGGGLVTS